MSCSSRASAIRTAKGWSFRRSPTPWCGSTSRIHGDRGGDHRPQGVGVRERHGHPQGRCHGGLPSRADRQRLAIPAPGSSPLQFPHRRNRAPGPMGTGTGAARSWHSAQTAGPTGYGARTVSPDRSLALFAAHGLCLARDKPRDARRATSVQLGCRQRRGQPSRAAPVSLEHGRPSVEGGASQPPFGSGWPRPRREERPDGAQTARASRALLERVLRRRYVHAR